MRLPIKTKAPDIAVAFHVGGIRNRYGGGDNINRVYRIRITVIIGNIKTIIELYVP